MFIHFIILVLSLFVFHSSSASDITVRKRIPNEPDGFYCGNRVFPQDYIEASKAEALEKFSQDAASMFEGSDSDYPEAYFGPLGFEKEDRYLLWPLVNSMPTKSVEEISPTYFLAIGSHSWKALGVVFKQPHEKDPRKTYVRCDQHEHLNTLQVQPEVQPEGAKAYVETGYRCPVEVFSIETVKIGLQELRLTRAKFQKGKVSKYGFPMKYNGRVLFKVWDPLYLWPITTSGRFSSGAPTLLVLDKRDNLVGMIYKKNEINHLKCLPSLSPKIEPQFIKLGPSCPDKTSDQNVLDVFRCGRSYIKSENLILNAIGAVRGFLQSRKKMAKYPLFVERLFEDGNEGIYLWPAMLTKDDNLPVNFRSIKKINTPFIKITDYCDIIDVVFYSRIDGKEKSCKRECIPKTSYLSTGAGYIDG